MQVVQEGTAEELQPAHDQISTIFSRQVRNLSFNPLPDLECLRPPSLRNTVLPLTSFYSPSTYSPAEIKTAPVGAGGFSKKRKKKEIKETKPAPIFFPV